MLNKTRWKKERIHDWDEANIVSWRFLISSSISFLNERNCMQFFFWLNEWNMLFRSTHTEGRVEQKKMSIRFAQQQRREGAGKNVNKFIVPKKLMDHLETLSLHPWMRSLWIWISNSVSWRVSLSPLRMAVYIPFSTIIIAYWQKKTLENRSPHSDNPSPRLEWIVLSSIFSHTRECSARW